MYRSDDTTDRPHWERHLSIVMQWDLYKATGGLSMQAVLHDKGFKHDF